MKHVVWAMLPLNEIIIASLNLINSDWAIIIIEELREEGIFIWLWNNRSKPDLQLV